MTTSSLLFGALGLLRILREGREAEITGLYECNHGGPSYSLEKVFPEV